MRHPKHTRDGNPNSKLCLNETIIIIITANNHDPLVRHAECHIHCHKHKTKISYNSRKVSMKMIRQLCKRHPHSPPHLPRFWLPIQVAPITVALRAPLNDREKYPTLIHLLPIWKQPKNCTVTRPRTRTTFVWERYPCVCHPQRLPSNHCISNHTYHEHRHRKPNPQIPLNRWKHPTIPCWQPAETRPCKPKKRPPPHRDPF